MKTMCFKGMFISSLVMCCVAGLVDVQPVSALEEPKEQQLFDGKTLTGWKGQEKFWSVKDGCIRGETTKENPTKGNTFLIWQGGEVADFDVKLEVKYSGNNSGIQYRSEVIDQELCVVKGYQCDLHPKAEYFGMLYAERWRGIVATRGQKLTVTGDKKEDIKVEKLPEDKRELVDNTWNEVRIVGVGNRIIHQINGVTVVDITDDYPNAPRKGVLAIQLHQGPAMVVEVKNIRLKQLDAQSGADAIKALSWNPNEPQISADGKIIVTSSEAQDGKVLAPSEIKVPPGFETQLLFTVPNKKYGSWVALTVDQQGDLIASDQGDKGLFRIKVKDEAGKTYVSVKTMPVNISGAQGLLDAFGGLYVHKSGAGLFKVTDSNQDGEYDQVNPVPSTPGGGEHGNHAVIVTEDGKEIYVDSGNHTNPPKDLAGSRIPMYHEGFLLPRQWDARGHARGIMAPGGWVTRMNPETNKQELYCAGFRNQYDIDLNEAGDMFTFDADMEWDMGAPWYRPTRICHCVSGADFGWRSGTGKWPVYYEDSLPPVVDIGPGSPTGVVHGKGAKFPHKYQHALYALDWTFGTLYAIHLKPEGASYTGTIEPFAVGAPLPLTDAVIGKDGNLYFTVGGRGTQSGLYRIVYTGSEATTPTKPDDSAEAIAARATRRELETFHGKVDPQAVNKAWPYLKSQDRFLRHAARIAVESQPVANWADKALAETDTQSIITSMVALARMGTADYREKILDKLVTLKLDQLSQPQLLGALRAYALTFIQFGKTDKTHHDQLVAKLSPLLPATSYEVNKEVIDLLVYLEEPSVIEKALVLMEQKTTTHIPDWSHLVSLNAKYGGTVKELLNNFPPANEIHYAFSLRNMKSGWTVEQRRRYFTFINKAAKGSGGASFPGFMTNIRNDALALCTNKEREGCKDITGENFNPVPNFTIKSIVGPGQKWTVESAMAELKPNFPKADFENGRSLYFATTCGKCHRMSGLGGDVGPDITSIPNKFDMKYVLESIIEPSKNISDQYQAKVVLTESGKSYTGLVLEEGDSYVIYPSDTAKPEDRVKKEEVLEIQPSKLSQMPDGLLDKLSPAELNDLMAYLMSGGNPEDKIYGKKKK